MYRRGVYFIEPLNFIFIMLFVGIGRPNNIQNLRNLLVKDILQSDIVCIDVRELGMGLVLRMTIKLPVNFFTRINHSVLTK